MPTAGFEPTISAGERPQTYALDRTATGTGSKYSYDLETFQATVTLYFCKLQNGSIRQVWNW
jgi:hypothetical protein